MLGIRSLSERCVHNRFALLAEHVMLRGEGWRPDVTIMLSVQ